MIESKNSVRLSINVSAQNQFTTPIPFFFYTLPHNILQLSFTISLGHLTSLHIFMPQIFQTFLLPNQKLCAPFPHLNMHEDFCNHTKIQTPYLTIMPSLYETKSYYKNHYSSAGRKILGLLTLKRAVIKCPQRRRLLGLD